MFFVLLSFCSSNFFKSKSSEQIFHPKTTKEIDHEDLVLTQAIGNYSNNNYISQHRVPNDSFTYYSPGDQSGHSIDLAFDGSTKTFWASSIPITETTKSYLTFTFASITCLEGIIYGPAYSTNRSVTPNTRRYDGFPRVLNIYTSLYDGPLQLRYTFRGFPAPKDVWDFIQLIFTEPIWCDKLKLEFVDVTLDISFGSEYTAACSEIIFMSPPEDYSIVETAQATGNYNTDSYINNNKITTDSFSYYSPGDKANKPASNAFDGNTGTYWVTSNPNSMTFKNYITLNFNSLTSLEAILFNMAYSTNRSVTPNTRRYDGIPLVLKVYTSSNNEPFKLSHVFKGGPRSSDLWARLQFVFQQPIWCDKLKLEFTELTFNAYDGNDYTVTCGELFLIRATTAVPTPIPAQTPQPNYISKTIVQATGDYNDQNYLNNNRVPTNSFSFSSPGDKANKPVSNAFDNDKGTYWVTSTVNTDTFKNYVDINFNSLTCIHSIVYFMAYSTNRSVTPNTRRYDGIPKILKVYTSSNGDPYKLSYVFTGGPTPSDLWDRLHFIFQEPIWCNKLKLEFTELSFNAYDGNDYSVVCGDLSILRGTPVATPTRSPKPTETPMATQSPSQSPTPSQSPSQSPTPVRTAHPGSSDDTYINKNYTNTIPASNNNQIQVGGNGEIKQISGCRFTDLNIDNRIFFIKVNGDASIFDNVFEFTSYTTGKAGCIWYNVNNGNKFIITNCKFIRVSGKDSDASVLNVNENTLSHIEFRDCEFIDCGEKENDRPIVNVLQQDSTIEFYNCNFSYEEPQISRVLELKGNGATFDNCRFDNCGQNSIDIGIGDITVNEHKTFTFTNNYVHSINTRFINAPGVRSKPIISNNIFEGCTLTSEYLIYIVHDQPEIEFISNTFTNIKNTGTSESRCGGLSSFVERSGSKYKLIYKECSFIDIINEHSQHPSSQGGAIQYFSSENYEVDIELNKCEFRSNKAYLHGGAVSIQTSGTVLITECSFESNEANYRASTSSLLFENYYDHKTNGFGGAIYLNPTFNKDKSDHSSVKITISGCTFTKNRAYQGYAIYIEGEESSTIYNINNNNFINNYASSGSPTTNAIFATEVLALTKEIIEGSNTFTNNEEGTDSEKFMRVDHKGKLLLEGDFVYGDENFTQSKPTDRIEKELDIFSADEVTVKVTVVVSEFTNKANEEGGAIHIVNCAIDCTGTTFNKCSAPNSGGGGIYIKNSGGKENNANLNGLVFNGCEAAYGGAIYAYSNSNKNPVVINGCTFTGNKATGNSDSGLSGGAAIFITARNGLMTSNTFHDNEGTGAVVKIYNLFKADKSKSMKLLNNNKNNHFTISDCSFTINKNADCCLFYVRGNHGTNVELQKCSFAGSLSSGSHYIDGKSLSKDGPKLLIKKCKFSGNSIDSLNMKDYLSIDLNDQTFVFDKSTNTKKSLSFTSWMIIAAVCLSAVIIVAVTILIFVVKKKKNANNNIETEMSTEVHDVLLDSSLI